MRELGITLSAHGVLSCGLPSGNRRGGDADATPGFRSGLRRFTVDNARHNLAAVDGPGAFAQEKNCSVVQLAIAWVLARGYDVLPLVVARDTGRLIEALGALDIALGSEDISRIDALILPVAIRGARDGAEQMLTLDIERGEGKHLEGRSAEG